VRTKGNLYQTARWQVRRGIDRPGAVPAAVGMLHRAGAGGGEVEVTQLNELGFYTLAGAPQSPAELLDEVATAESLALGSAFISERFSIKEAATLSGAVGAVSHTLGIATAATNHNTRHPQVTASYATTMHRLTGGRRVTAT
jgi:hypothetical protein